LDYDGTGVEIPMAADINRVVIDGIQSAATKLGELEMKVQWLPEKDSFDLLVEEGMNRGMQSQKNLLVFW
jgi:hypothetical protein